jgi:hypothetical protein
VTLPKNYETNTISQRKILTTVRSINGCEKIPKVILMMLISGICLAYGESRYNTSVVGSLNGDGSKDFGLFQISEKYWCSQGKSGNACGRKCEGMFISMNTFDLKNSEQLICLFAF